MWILYAIIAVIVYFNLKSRLVNLSTPPKIPPIIIAIFWLPVLIYILVFGVLGYFVDKVQTRQKEQILQKTLDNLSARDKLDAVKQLLLSSKIDTSESTLVKESAEYLDHLDTTLCEMLQTNYINSLSTEEVDQLCSIRQRVLIAQDSINL